MTPSDPTAAADETEWLAVRYVLGELPAGDATAFEARLADDQSAREAIARAAFLVEAIADVPRPVAKPVPARRTSRKVVAAIASLAAALLVGIVLWPAARPVQTSRRPSPDEVDPAQLVVLWSDAGTALDGEIESDSLGDDDSDAAVIPPDWLLAAVEQETMSAESDPSLDLGSDEIRTN